MERIFWMGCIICGNLAARATECFTVPPYSLIVIIPDSPLHTKVCISLHAQSSKLQTTCRFTSHSTSVGFQYETSLISPYFRCGFCTSGNFAHPLVFWITELRKIIYSDVSKERVIPIFTDSIRFK